MDLEALEGVRARAERISQRELGGALALMIVAFFGEEPEAAEVQETLMHRGVSRLEAERIASLWARLRVLAPQGG